MKRKLTTEEMKIRFTSGSTLNEIGKASGITAERVRQILKKFGLTRRDGGAWLRETVAERQARATEERCARQWGMSFAEERKIRMDYGPAPFAAFRQQRKNARRRGIPFNLTFAQWWALWQQSGRWAERGKGRYVMGRFGDKGPYAIGNVKIITQSANTIEYFESIRTPFDTKSKSPSTVAVG